MFKRLAYTAAIALLAAAMFASRPASAQIPTFAEVTGHDIGERITQHHEAVLYLKALAETSDRVRIMDQGETWEGRRLLVAIVTSPQNHQRLDAIQQAAQRLGDPRVTTPDEAAAIVGKQPVILWYGGSIHGFELSGAEGLLKLLEHLTTCDDPATMDVLANAVILIDPTLNPDGHDAFAHLNHENISGKPNPDRNDWANDFTDWQAVKFRTGHYYFDTNRDWFAQTQRETQARAPTIIAWRPQIVVDMHEMSPDDPEFYFDPGMDPYAPYFPEHSKRWDVVFSQAYAEAFDAAGLEYMTREAFEDFYPGYTTSFGDYQGAVGQTYEQASSRGLARTRFDYSVRTLADALEQQYTAAWTAARTATANRDKLLSEYYEALRAAIAEGGQGIRRYLIAPEGDPQLVAELANMLMRNGIEVGMLTESARLGNVRDRAGADVGARDFPIGTYVVEAAQPREKFIRILLEPDVPTPEDFLREARARIERGQDPQFYDITAWSLPLLFDVGGYSTSDGRALSTRELTETVEVTASFPSSPPRYAYLIDGKQTASLSALYHLKAHGYRVAVIRKATKIEGRDFSSGTVIVRVGQNDESVHEAVRKVAERFHLEVDGVDTGMAEVGFPVLGSGDWVTTARQAKVAILAEDPIEGYSFGWAWYTLDQQYQIPVTVLRVGSIADTPLDDYNTLIVPSAGNVALTARLGEGGVERLKNWVHDGGTLIALGSATDFAREQFKLALRSWYELEENEDAQRFTVPGAIFMVKLNEYNWLTAGYDAPTLPVLVDSDRIYLMPEGPPSSQQRAVARYSTDGSRVSGYAWPECLERMQGAVFAYEERVGSGRVIAFTEDVNFRAYWRGANRLFLNAVVLGPSSP